MRHLLLVFVAVALVPKAASAQVEPTALTFEEAYTRAIETSHRLAEARARHEAAEAAIDIPRAGERLAVTVNGGYTRTNHVNEFGVPQPNGMLGVIYPDIPDNYFTRAAFQWPIYTSGRVDALAHAAEAEARAVDAEVQVARADLRLEVARAYWALVTATDSVRVLREAVDRAEAHLRDVRQMFATGLVPPNDVATVDAQRSLQQVQLIEAENLRRSVAEDIRRLTGLGDRVEIVTTARLVAPAATAPAPPADVLATALKQRAERQAIAERATAAESREVAAAAARKPTIALSGAVDYANPNPHIFPRRAEWRESWDLTANVSWSLWDSGRSKAEMAEARDTANAFRERLADLDSVIAVDIRQRQFDIESANAAIAASEDAVRSAEEARRVVGERFRVGVATSTEVLDAQVALLQAQLDRTRALANLKLAEARLDRAVGR